MNLSIETGIFPTKLKYAKIIPIFKLGNKDDPTNYRPISLLSNINKMFERLMYNRLITFIERNNVLYSSQYGFRNNHSTEHALLDIVKNLKSLETIVNEELIKLNDWLISNKLSLNIKKSNFVIFHTYQKTLNYNYT